MSTAPSEHGVAAALSAASSAAAFPLAITLAVGLMSALGLWWYNRPKSQRQLTPEQREAIIAKARPTDGVFTIDSLVPFDGSDILPLYMSCCGKVVDCSSSENISYGAGYGKLWAGRDATYALATLSLKPEEANKLDFKLSDFTEDQSKALAGWYKHFTTKYPIVGSMKEYDDWDFSEIMELAASQTPFGAKATVAPPREPNGFAAPAMPSAAPPMPDAADAGTAPATAKADLPDGAVVLAKGDRVMVTGHKERPELIGAMGTLTDFVPAEGRFRVELDKDRGTELFRPSELAKSAKKPVTAF